MAPETPSVLRRILEKKRERLEEAKSFTPLSELRSAVRDLEQTRDFLAAVGGAGDPEGNVRIIAEFKRRSPSRGMIREEFDLQTIHKAYREGGADAYSILTEQDFFGGSLEYLRTLKRVASVPCLRKDFLLDAYQIYESRWAGADAFLLIASVLTEAQIQEFLVLGGEMGMAGLVEVHSEEELEKVLGTGARLIGVNNRDLRTFEVNLDTTIRLRTIIPTDRTVISESGIHSKEDVARLLQAGVRAFLIGEHFMKSENIAEAVRELKGTV
jgi:indole-3-glycerol phosphate synthase